MYPRTNYEMTEADFKELLDACKPTVCIKVGNYTGSSPQENANRAWARLGEKMRFDYETVQPQPGMGERFFTAIPNETPEAKAAREEREKEDALRDRIKTLGVEIKERQDKLVQILSSLTRNSAPKKEELCQLRTTN